jgi:calcineurin-like phosphoesterase family protein
MLLSRTGTIGRATLAAAGLALMVGAACGKATTTGPGGGTGGGNNNSDPGPWVLIGAGDIGWCDRPGSESTAKLLEANPSATVFTAGDNAYPGGRPQDFGLCYDPSWGRVKSRTKPTPGNHDYATAGAGPYFDYFGGSAGVRGAGYYSFTRGPWLILMLNSEQEIRAGSVQHEWIGEQLAAHPTGCQMAIWHRPLFTSGANGPNPDMRDMFKAIYDLGVDVLINGHDHIYERFAPQDPNGKADPLGVRQFIVGTGGADLYQRAMTAPNSEAFINNTYGVLKLTLTVGSYQWEFIPTTGSARDSGGGTCH